MHLKFLRIFEFSSSLLDCALPTTGSANSMHSLNSKTIDVTNRKSGTGSMPRNLRPVRALLLSLLETNFLPLRHSGALAGTFHGHCSQI